VLINSFQQAERIVKVIIGFTLLALGIVMIATPGPGWITIMLALGILAAEFVWAASARSPERARCEYSGH
jgi:uncharacterized protein (TIGR02611 family)